MLSFSKHQLTAFPDHDHSLASGQFLWDISKTLVDPSLPNTELSVKL